MCVDEAGDIIEEDGEIEEEEEDEETVFALALSEDSDCEDKEYMGKLTEGACARTPNPFKLIYLFDFFS